MARDYGQDMIATIAIRLTKQEKDAVKREAAARSVSISNLVRAAIAAYIKEAQ